MASTLPVRQRVEGFAFLTAYILTIPIANWMIGNVGTTCVPQGPCLIPVAPGLMAPSGVLLVGAALVLRDLVQRRLGVGWSLAAILIGGALSWLVAPPMLVLASVAAFTVSELADFAVYTPLQRKRFVMAVILSSSVGLIIDSMIFLQLAFGDLTFVWGQIVGKGWMVLIAIPLIALLRRRDNAIGLGAA